MMGHVATESERLFERRRHPRIAVAVDARCWVRDPDAAVRCDVADISTGGMCLRLPPRAEVEPGGYAMVELPVPDGSAHSTTRVRVHEVVRGLTVQAHVSFLDRTPVFRRMIEDATAAWRR